MHEIVVNLHMHTTYSDGYSTHTEIAQAAIQARTQSVITSYSIHYTKLYELLLTRAKKSVKPILPSIKVNIKLVQPQKNLEHGPANWIQHVPLLQTVYYHRPASKPVIPML